MTGSRRFSPYSEQDHRDSRPGEGYNHSRQTSRDPRSYNASTRGYRPLHHGHQLHWDDPNPRSHHPADLPRGRQCHGRRQVREDSPLRYEDTPRKQATCNQQVRVSEPSPSHGIAKRRAASPASAHESVTKKPRASTPFSQSHVPESSYQQPIENSSASIEPGLASLPSADPVSAHESVSKKPTASTPPDLQSEVPESSHKKPSTISTATVQSGLASSPSADPPDYDKLQGSSGEKLIKVEPDETLVKGT